MEKSRLKLALTTVVTASMILPVLAGCGSSGSETTTDASGATVIKFGIHVANPQKQEAVTYDIVQAFNAKYKGKFKVEFEASDKESHSKNMKLEASDGTLPQIFWLDGAEAPDYSDSDVLMDMKDFLKQNPDVEKALAGSQNAYKRKGVLYGLPYQSNVQGFFYNKALFDKAGVSYPTDDTTYDQFLEMVKKLKKSGVTPIAIGSKNSAYTMWEFNEFLERYGWSENISSILSGKKKFNNSDMQKAFDKIKGLADADAFPENLSTIEYFDAKQQFDDKKAAMFGTGQWDATEFDQNIGKDIGFWWGPKFQDSKYEQNVSMKVPSAPIVVAKTVEDNDAQKKAVYAFLKYYYGKDAAKLSYAKSAFPATSYTGFKAADDQYSMNAMIAALDKGWKSPSSAPDLSVPSSVQQVLYNSIFGVIQKNYSPTEALNKLDQSLSY